MYLELDGQGPKYAQLARAIKTAILNGSIVADERLPPTRALMHELGLSRITVLAAYEKLRVEGYVRSLVGSGSYVNALLAQPAPPMPSAKPIPPPSHYAERARLAQNRLIARQHHGLRYDLQYGYPLTDASLTSIWGRELARAATCTSLDRAPPQGSLQLREQVCRYLAQSRGVQAHPSHVLIVNAFQQAITLTARVLVNEGDTVVVEDPHYFGAWQALRAHGAQMYSVPTDNNGLVCAELPERAPSLICVTPSHQFPTGSVLSLPRRRELLQYAEANQCWILEDDYDSEFRYDSQPIAALRSLDHGDRVIYAGTFTKALFPSMRLGYMVLPSALCDDFINAKYLCDHSCSAIEQAALAHFIEGGGYTRHHMRTMKALRARRRELIEGFHRYAGERVQVADSHAGMHLVVWLRSYSYDQVDALIAYAKERGLGLYPMAPHYEQRPATPGLLLGYCSLSPLELRSAMQLFGECLDAIDAMSATDIALYRSIASPGIDNQQPSSALKI